MQKERCGAPAVHERAAARQQCMRELLRASSARESAVWRASSARERCDAPAVHERAAARHSSARESESRRLRPTFHLLSTSITRFSAILSSRVAQCRLIFASSVGAFQLGFFLLVMHDASTTSTRKSNLWLPLIAATTSWCCTVLLRGGIRRYVWFQEGLTATTSSTSLIRVCGQNARRPIEQK